MKGRAAAIETSPPEIKARWLNGPAMVLSPAALKFVLHIASAGRYGVFRDELYYLACGLHLAWPTATGAHTLLPIGLKQTHSGALIQGPKSFH